MKPTLTIGAVLGIVVLAVVATWTLLSAGEREMSVAIAKNTAREAELEADQREQVADFRAKIADEEKNAAEQKATYEKEVADEKTKAAESTTDLTNRVTRLTAKNKKLSVELAAATADTTSLKVPTGEARFIADDRVAVGVESVSGSFATVRIGDYDSIDMYPGESRAVQLGDKSFVVTLMKIEATGCVFAVRKG